MAYAIVDAAPSIILLTYGRANASDNAADNSAKRTIFANKLPLNVNRFTGGAGKIVGTVAQKALPANTPLRRKVLLFQEPAALLIGCMWSDASDGSYSFYNLDMLKTYTVVSYDYTNTFRAVIADRVVPELIV